MDIRSLIAWNVTRIRQGQDLSQEELANRCETLYQGFISNLEKGKHNPSVQTLVLLANALNVTVSEFFNTHGAPAKILQGPLIVKSRRFGIKEVEIDLGVFVIPSHEPSAER